MLTAITVVSLLLLPLFGLTLMWVKMTWSTAVRVIITTVLLFCISSGWVVMMITGLYVYDAMTKSGFMMFLFFLLYIGLPLAGLFCMWLKLNWTHSNKIAITIGYLVAITLLFVVPPAIMQLFKSDERNAIQMYEEY